LDCRQAGYCLERVLQSGLVRDCIFFRELDWFGYTARADSSSFLACPTRRLTGNAEAGFANERANAELPADMTGDAGLARICEPWSRRTSQS